jgi:hypothetical protein
MSIAAKQLIEMLIIQLRDNHLMLQASVKCTLYVLIVLFFLN